MTYLDAPPGRASFHSNPATCAVAGHGLGSGDE